MSKGSESRDEFDPDNLRAGDVLILVPLIIVVSICLIGFRFLVSDEVYIKWGGLGLNTAVLFGFLFYRTRELLKARPFWIFAGCFLLLHLAAWITLLSIVDEWRLPWFGLMALEAPIFLTLSSRTAPLQ